MCFAKLYARIVKGLGLINKPCSLVREIEQKLWPRFFKLKVNVRMALVGADLGRVPFDRFRRFLRWV